MRWLRGMLWALGLLLVVSSVAWAATGERWLIPVTVGGQSFTLRVWLENGALKAETNAAGVVVGAVQVEAAPAPTAGASTMTVVRVKQNANLRSGPGTGYGIAGQAKAGQDLQVVGQNGDGTWYQLANGGWIAAFLVDSAPATASTASAPSTAANQPAPTAVPPTPVPTVAPVAQNCDPSYPDVCIPPAPPDLNCPDVNYRRFKVVGADPHGFDRDHDGIGCES